VDRPHPNLLKLPSNESVIAWLREHDRKPKIVPDWPGSRHIGIVVVFEDQADDAAIVAVTEESLHHLAALSKVDSRRRLFFQVPWDALEKACPGCTGGRQ
jgi:hypothetical protein